MVAFIETSHIFNNCRLNTFSASIHEKARTLLLQVNVLCPAIRTEPNLIPIEANMIFDLRGVLQTGVCCAVLGLCLSCAHDCQADLVTVINPSFEDISGETIVNEFTFGPLNGWDLYDPNGITGGGAGNTFFIGTLTPNPPVYFIEGAPDGDRVGIAFNFFGSGNLGEYGMQQTLSDTLQPNTHYNLQVEIGNIASGTGVNGQSFVLDGFPGYRVELLAGDQVIAQDNNTLAGSIPEGEFLTSSIEFTSGLTHAQMNELLGIRLINLNQVDSAFPNADLEVDFDHVRLTAVSAVPEPTALIPLSILAATLLARRKRIV
jgi:hypothetical protein